MRIRRSLLHAAVALAATSQLFVPARPAAAANGTVVVINASRPCTNCPSGVFTALSMSARYDDGTPFTGAIQYGSGPVGTVPELTETVTTDEFGSAWIMVEIREDPVQVLAYADRADAGSVGSPDPTEIMGSTVVARADIATFVTYDRPVYTCACPAGSYVDIEVMPRDALLGANSRGPVHYGSGPLGPTPPSYTATATIDLNSRAILTVRVEDHPVHIVAFADRGPNAGTNGVQDDDELTGHALLVRSDLP